MTRNRTPKKQKHSRRIPILFSEQFLEDHVGYLIDDPYLSIVELIANSYDAGATCVEIKTPTAFQEQLVVKDNGTGMTRAEFEHRWSKLSYSRLEEQGDTVIFPPGVKGIQRTALGTTGKGRHGAFCFDDTYRVETHKGDEHSAAEVRLVRSEEMPFEVNPKPLKTGPAHGTTISATVTRNLVVADKLRELIGSRFLVDPSFSIKLNGKQIDLFAMTILKTETIRLPKSGMELRAHRIAPREVGRDSQMRGVTWWVNKRMVGAPSWQSFSGEAYLDARKAEAKKYSFVIEADFLKQKECLKKDWSGFHTVPVVIEALEYADAYIQRQLDILLSRERKQSKMNAIRTNAKLVGELPPISRAAVEMFVDEIQQKCTVISERDLAKTVEVYAKLEQTKSGYDLLAQLAACSPEDLDKWNSLMKMWTATNAEVVLDELHRRLSLITKLSHIVEQDRVDELHEIHPLFERGLWMFGPEYESVDFRSNRGMAEVIHNFFGKKKVTVSRNRMDIVAIPKSSIAAYSAPAFNIDHEMDGWRSVLIVELKTTGLPITMKEVDQARDYCNELYDTGAVGEGVPIRAYVLGTTLDAKKESTYGKATIVPRTYANVLDNAQVRTFHLQQRLQQVGTRPIDDRIIETLFQPSVEPNLVS